MYTIQWRQLRLWGYRHMLHILPCGLGCDLVRVSSCVWISVPSRSRELTTSISCNDAVLVHSSLRCSLLSFCSHGGMSSVWKGARNNSTLEPEIIKNFKVNTSRFSSTDWRRTQVELCEFANICKQQFHMVTPPMRITWRTMLCHPLSSAAVQHSVTECTSTLVGVAATEAHRLWVETSGQPTTASRPNPATACFAK